MKTSVLSTISNKNKNKSILPTKNLTFDTAIDYISVNKYTINNLKVSIIIQIVFQDVWERELLDFILHQWGVWARHHDLLLFIWRFFFSFEHVITVTITRTMEIVDSAPSSIFVAKSTLATLYPGRFFFI